MHTGCVCAVARAAYDCVVLRVGFRVWCVWCACVQCVLCVFCVCVCGMVCVCTTWWVYVVCVVYMDWVCGVGRYVYGVCIHGGYVCNIWYGVLMV